MQKPLGKEGARVWLQHSAEPDQAPPGKKGLQLSPAQPGDTGTPDKRLLCRNTQGRGGGRVENTGHVSDMTMELAECQEWTGVKDNSKASTHLAQRSLPLTARGNSREACRAGEGWQSSVTSFVF